jgi:hypothetical protein
VPLGAELRTLCRSFEAATGSRAVVKGERLARGLAEVCGELDRHEDGCISLL